GSPPRSSLDASARQSSIDPALSPMRTSEARRVPAVPLEDARYRRDSVSIEIVWPSGSTPTRHVGQVVGVEPSLKWPALNTRSHLSHVTNVSLWRPAKGVTTIESGTGGVPARAKPPCAAPLSVPDRASLQAGAGQARPARWLISRTWWTMPR